ncbi:MAG: aminotransferase class III-fold pyridoxal phosphate-dependent enzyme [Acetobacteraceae bacterium]|jgi:4-aminobutyrate aminotransferase|nr:aminotransferase class III-fold pyridoxal phosphate-dependent enzyme [Acetobacteraceae bacterium]
MSDVEALVARDAATFFRQRGSTPCLSALSAASGAWLVDADGRRYLDLHGNTVHHLGHGHPRLVAALKEQLDTLPFCPRRFTNDQAVALAEALLAHWPGRPARVLFATGGSDAIEIALKLARVATGRHETLSFEGSYHGDGFGALGLGSARHDARLGPLLPGRHHLTPYWVDAGRAIDEARRLLARGRIAALVAEPMRSSCHVPPEGFWPEIRRLCNDAGTKLIFDEIPSGLGKTGRFFAFEHVGAVPDAAVLGKALGGGIVPIAAVIADAAMDVAPELALGHYTHEKNPLTCRAALETLRIIAEEGLVARAARMGEVLVARVAAATGLTPRGLGLLRVLPLPEAWHGRAEAFAQAAFAEGLSATAKGSDGYGLSLPLTVTEDEIAFAAGGLARVLATAPA